MTPRALARIGIGANLGDAVGTVERAILELHNVGDVRERSSLYRSKAWGVTEQPDFINAAALVETALAPRDLLHALKALEAKLGRTVTYRWGPRVVDLDILAYGDAVVREPDLVIPHERLFERAFALGPLAEIDPAFREAYARLSDAARAEVRRLSFAIRDLRADDPSDARAVALLLARVADEGLYLATEAPVDVDALAARIAHDAALRRPIVAVERARVIGELTIFGIESDERGPRRGRLGICVIADWRGRGVGRALLEAGIVRAAEFGLGALELEVFPHNAVAIALYERCGFERSSVRRRAFPRKSGEIWDAIVMRRRVDPIRPAGTSPSTL